MHLQTRTRGPLKFHRSLPYLLFTGVLHCNLFANGFGLFSMGNAGAGRKLLQCMGTKSGGGGPRAGQGARPTQDYWMAMVTGLDLIPPMVRTKVMVEPLGAVSGIWKST